MREALDERSGAHAASIRHRNLHVDVRTPRRDLAGLAFHLVELIREDLERDGFVRNRRDDFLRESAIVTNSGLVHQRRVRREPADVRQTRKGSHARQVSTIAKNLHTQMFKTLHGILHAMLRINGTASVSDSVRRSGSISHGSSWPELTRIVAFTPARLPASMSRHRSPTMKLRG